MATTTTSKEDRAYMRAVKDLQARIAKKAREDAKGAGTSEPSPSMISAALKSFAVAPSMAEGAAEAYRAAYRAESGKGGKGGGKGAAEKELDKLLSQEFSKVRAAVERTKDPASAAKAYDVVVEANGKIESYISGQDEAIRDKGRARQARLREISSAMVGYFDRPTIEGLDAALKKAGGVLRALGYQGPSGYQKIRSVKAEQARQEKIRERELARQEKARKKEEAPFRKKYLAQIEAARRALKAAGDPAASEIPAAGVLKSKAIGELSDWVGELQERVKAIRGAADKAASSKAEKAREAAAKAASKAEKAREAAAKAASKAAAKAASKAASKAEKAAAREQAKEARKRAREAEKEAKEQGSELARLARELQLSPSQRRTEAMFEGEAPAPAPEGVKFSKALPRIPFTMDALLLASDNDAARLIAVADKNQRRALKLALVGELKIVRREIKRLKDERRQRLQQIRERARAAAKSVRARMIELRKDFLRQWKELQEEDRARLGLSKSDTAAVIQESTPAIAAAQERAARALGLSIEINKYKKPPTPKQIELARKRAEAQRESDQMVGFDLQREIPGAERWWAEKGVKMRDFKPAALRNKKKSRVEAVLEFLAESPGLLDDFFQEKAVKELKAREREEAKLSKEYERAKVQAAGRDSRRLATVRRQADRRSIMGRRSYYKDPTPFLSAP